MPFLQNSITQHQNAQASGAWSLQNPLACDTSLYFRRVPYRKSLTALSAQATFVHEMAGYEMAGHGVTSLLKRTF